MKPVPSKMYYVYLLKSKIRILIIGLLCIVNSTIAYSETQHQANTPDWKIYRNKKYGYEIKYPRSINWPAGGSLELDLWLTGLSSERDGRSFRIAPKNLSIPSTIDVHLYPGLTIDKISSFYINPEADQYSGTLIERVENLRKSLKDDYTILLTEIVINGVKGAKVEHLFSSGELAGFDIFLDGVAFTYSKTALPLDEKIAEEIISTFRFLKRK